MLDRHQSFLLTAKDLVVHPTGKTRGGARGGGGPAVWNQILNHHGPRWLSAVSRIPPSVANRRLPWWLYESFQFSMPHSRSINTSISTHRANLEFFIYILTSKHRLKGRRTFPQFQAAVGPVTAISNGVDNVALEAWPPPAKCEGGWRSRHMIRRLTAQPPFHRAAGRTADSAGGCEAPFHMAVGPPAPYKTQQHPGGD
jgi:hypothetical protein